MTPSSLPPANSTTTATPPRRAARALAALLPAALLLTGLAGCGDDGEGGAQGVREDALSCGEPLLVCGEGCVDTRVDPEHCGECDNACDDDAYCTGGQCVPRCGRHGAMCGDTCVDTRATRDHCGLCGNACDGDDICDDGQCVAFCGDGRDECDGGCFDLQDSDAHCGACGQACDDGERCQQGACVAASEGGDAAGDGDGDGAAGENATAADCCEARDEGGCGTPDVQACVCEADSFCCEDAWDDTCVDLVVSAGCGVCAAVAQGTCEISDSSDALPATFRGTLDGAADDLETTCGPFVETDVLFAYTAPAAGSYTFDTSGSDVEDTVLAVLDGSSCDGEELGCNDDAGGELISRLTLELSAGQEVLVVVENWSGGGGDVQVSVSASSASPDEPLACNTTELSGGLPLSVTGTVSAGASHITPSCAEYGSEGELLYSFTAAQAGTYRFDTTGSDADTILQILDGDCDGAELACNDDPDVDVGGFSAVVDVALSAGQTVVVNLDSFDGLGDFVLNVDRTGDGGGDVSAGDGACCSPHAAGGCNDAAVQACVCADDDYCCTDEWDELCVDSIAALGCGTCQ